MLFSMQILCVDETCLSRVDQDSMSDQCLMELLVSNIARISAFKDADGDFLEFEKWSGVSVKGDNQELEVDFSREYGNTLFQRESDDITSYIIGPGGSINFRWLPGGVLEFAINGLDLVGTIETSELPRKMQYLDIAENKFTGTFDMEAMPCGMTYISINTNRFEGTLNMMHCPASLTHFRAKNNQFSGSLELTHLPEGIRSLYFDMNRFSGELDLSKLPDSLTNLYVRNNFFSQDKLVVRRLRRITLGADREKFGKIVDEDGFEPRRFR